MFSGFQNNAFQRNAYQIVTGGAAVVVNVAGKLKKKLRRDTRVKARADELAEKYQRTLKSESVQAEVVQEIIKPFIKAEAEIKPAPKVIEIDFEAMAQNAKARKSFLEAVKLLMQQEEEEMVLTLLLATI